MFAALPRPAESNAARCPPSRAHAAGPESLPVPSPPRPDAQPSLTGCTAVIKEPGKHHAVRLRRACASRIRQVLTITEFPTCGCAAIRYFPTPSIGVSVALRSRAAGGSAPPVPAGMRRAVASPAKQARTLRGDLGLAARHRGGVHQPQHLRAARACGLSASRGSAASIGAAAFLTGSLYSGPPGPRPGALLQERPPSLVRYSRSRPAEVSHPRGPRHGSRCGARGSLSAEWWPGPRAEPGSRRPGCSLQPFQPAGVVPAAGHAWLAARVITPRVLRERLAKAIVGGADRRRHG